MMDGYPTTLTELESELLQRSQDGRSDALFRHAIAMENIGSLTRYLTHDQELNPLSRPHGSKNGEINAAGHGIVQLCTYVALRGIKLQDAVNSALPNLRTKDFIARKHTTLEQPDDCISGLCACEGRKQPFTGFAFVDPLCIHLGNMPYGSILVASHPESGISIHQHRMLGIITDQGGVSCHAAIVARENNISCIVGTVTATQRIKTGDILLLDAGRGCAEILEDI